MCQTFHNGRFADARLTDQHRIIFRATLQHLNRTTDFFITTNHWVKLALLGALGHIDGVFFQRLTLLFDIRIGNGITTTHLSNGAFQAGFGGAGFTQRLTHVTFVLQRSEQKEFT